MTLYSDYVSSISAGSGSSPYKKTVILSASELISNTQTLLVPAPASGYYVNLIRVEASLGVNSITFTSGDVKIGYPSFLFLTLRDFLNSSTAVHSVTPNVEFSPLGATSLVAVADGLPINGDSTVNLTVHYEILPL
jgi:hypothetical protein